MLSAIAKAYLGRTAEKAATPVQTSAKQGGLSALAERLLQRAKRQNGINAVAAPLVGEATGANDTKAEAIAESSTSKQPASERRPVSARPSSRRAPRSMRESVDRSVEAPRSKHDVELPATPAPEAPATSPVLVLDEPQTEAKRRNANLAAMRLAAELKHSPRPLSDDDRRTLGAYSGWGGLSIKAAAGQFPEGFPVPEERGLIHEYYTPSNVCAEVARVVAPLLSNLAGADGVVHALEPSAGIGRFVRAFDGPGFEKVEWHAVEWSALSAAMLRALRPQLDLYEGPFERWVAAHEKEYAGRLNLIVANPPYGARAHTLTEDPAREYREDNAYAYFLRRGLDLLAPGGLGVYLVPSGFLSGTSKHHVERRAKVLRKHHLACAFRLPSKLFPGAMLVTDLLFFRARGGTLPEIDEADRFILEGRYFGEHPSHILGTVVGVAGNDDDQTKPAKRGRWGGAAGAGYEVIGEFTSLPALRERPMCVTCQHAVASAPPPPPPIGAKRRQTEQTNDDKPYLSAASSLGRRVATFLAAVAAQDSEEPSLAWQELHQGLVDWATQHGPPSADVQLVKLAKSDVGAQRFLAAFVPRTANVIPALAQRPVWSPRYQGSPDDVIALAEFLYRQRRSLRRDELGRLDIAPLFAAGWCEDSPGELVPPDVYYYGELWPKVERAKERATQGDEQAKAQVAKLMALISPAIFDDIEGISPRQGWVPLSLVGEWMAGENRGYPVNLVREDGLVQVEGRNYQDLEKSTLPETIIQKIGWMNHDRVLFRPSHAKTEDIDDVRLRVAAEWEMSFKAWCSANDARKKTIQDAYRAHFQGFRAPGYSAEPMKIARWSNKRIPHPWQNAGARRVLANRGGLIAFDVGVGKTDTGLLVLAGARQEGWAKRPVILVPKSIVWKWVRDINRALPDYRIGVVGSKRKVVAHGPRKGQITSETDSPFERAATWSRFMGGEYDVVLLTYQALSRTKMREESVIAYAKKTAAIQREVKLRQRNAEKKKKLSEREIAILNEGTSAWVAEMMELPEGWKHDEGILWEDIGVDLLIVDEAQNFKNLYLPEPREHGVPKFMGNAGSGSRRAWQLDFRAASVRSKTGGAGIVLLSATPAKNSPLEFYNIIQYVDDKAFPRQGIHDSEAFIDRYCRIEPRDVVGSNLDVETKSACVGFTSLDNLRATIFRYGEFRTAEEVGLKIPDPEVRIIEVAMNEEQSTKYDHLVFEIERAMADPVNAPKGAILAALARMALVAIHPNLDESYTWQTAKKAPTPHSPKFDALANEVNKHPSCGHIVFCDNIAAHYWIRKVLEEAGIAAERIAVLNGEVAPNDVDRLRIAMDFNGNPEEGVPPLYDVILCNAIAYEGVDLQTRTCAIHHIDLPWEPATLEQRNGRGRRQGNTFATIQILYYFASRSSDGMRFNLIQGKRGWMTDLLESQKKATNNPGAQDNLTPEEVLLLISRDPDKMRERLNEVKRKREEEARKKIATEASATLRAAVSRFWDARRQRDPQEAARLREEANLRLEDLARVDKEAWPWASWAMAARDRAMLVPLDGSAPVYEGLRIAKPNTFDPGVTDYAEFGKTFEGKTIGVRAAGAMSWKRLGFTDLAGLKLQPQHEATTWPEDDEKKMDTIMQGSVLRELRTSGAYHVWMGLQWECASDAFVERAWAKYGDAILEAFKSQGWMASRYTIPVQSKGVLLIKINTDYDAGIPPTQAGWEEFLRLAPGSGIMWSDLDKTAKFWWGRGIPRTLLSDAKAAAEGANEGENDDEENAS